MVSDTIAKYNRAGKARKHAVEQGNTAAIEEHDREIKALWQEILSAHPQDKEEALIIFSFLKQCLIERMEGFNDSEELLHRFLKLASVHGEELISASSPRLHSKSEAQGNVGHVANGGDTDHTTPEYYALLVSLMAKMSKADGKVLDIENFTALAVLQSDDQIDTSVQSAAEHQYRKATNSRGTLDLTETEKAQLVTLSPSDRLSLIRTLAGIAACDGSVHLNEQAILDEVTLAMQMAQ